MTVVGARPQFIKAAALSRVLQENATIKEVLVHTGQHYDNNMSKIFFDELGIPKIDYQLGITSGSHGKQTGEMIYAIENVLLAEKPDWLLIYGDTNSTLAAALAASKCHIPIAHVEAGLRSYNRKMPEEINRLVADQLSEVLFTPTKQSVINLKLEGYADKNIIEVGDVMYDAALFYAEKAEISSHILEELNHKNNKYILATIHRAENTDDMQRLTTIFEALERLSKVISVIMPLHPRTKKLLSQLSNQKFKNSSILMIEPVGFLDMIVLEKNASLIVTDSGGVQKEAYFYRIPCVTLRDETEWVETVNLGWNKLVKITSSDDIYENIIERLDMQGLEGEYPFGCGDACDRIAKYFIQE